MASTRRARPRTATARNAADPVTTADIDAAAARATVAERVMNPIAVRAAAVRPNVPIGRIARVSIDTPALTAAILGRLVVRHGGLSATQAEVRADAQAARLVHDVLAAAGALGALREGPRRPDAERRSCKALAQALTELFRVGLGLAGGRPPTNDPAEVGAEYGDALADARTIVEFAGDTFEAFAVVHPALVARLDGVRAGAAARLFARRERRGTRAAQRRTLARDILSDWFDVDARTIDHALKTALKLASRK